MKIKTSISILIGCLVIFLFIMLPIILSVQDKKDEYVASITGSSFSLKDVNNNVITAENENNIFFYTYDEDDYPISINSPNGSDYKSNIQINITYTN